MTREETSTYILGLKDAQVSCDTEMDCIDMLFNHVRSEAYLVASRTANNIKDLIQDKIGMMEQKK